MGVVCRPEIYQKVIGLQSSFKKFLKHLLVVFLYAISLQLQIKGNFSKYLEQLLFEK